MDALGNPAPGFPGPVQAAVVPAACAAASPCGRALVSGNGSSPAGPVAAGDYAAAAADASVAFGLRVDAAGAYRALFWAAGLAAAQSEPFVVEPGPVAAVLLLRPPAGFRAGAAFRVQPVLGVADSAGNRVNASAGRIAAALDAGRATGPGAWAVLCSRCPWRPPAAAAGGG